MKAVNDEISTITSSLKTGGKTGVLIVTIPGVFADERQYSPIRQHLLRHGDELAVSYRDDIDTRRVPADIAACVFGVFHAHRYEQIIIIGTSLGGMFAVEAVNECVRLGIAKSQIGLVVADALINDEDGVNPVEKTLSKMIMRTPRLLDSFAKKALDRFLVPPRPENVEPYNATADYSWIGEGIDSMNHYPRLVEYAMTSMKRASFRRHVQHLRYMCAMNEESLGIARLEGIKTVYICCVGPQNVTIKQPQTVNRYLRYAPHIHVYNVEGAHVGYAEQSAKWSAVYEDVLTQLLDELVKPR